MCGFCRELEVNRLDIIIHSEVIPVQHFGPVGPEPLPFYIYFRDQFIDYWIRSNMLAMDLPTRIYNILKQPHRTYLVQVWFVL
jgi:hypothetical protein